MKGARAEEEVAGAGPFAGGGGTLEEENRAVMSLAQFLAVPSWFDPSVEGCDDIVDVVRGDVDVGHQICAEVLVGVIRRASFVEFDAELRLVGAMYGGRVTGYGERRGGDSLSCRRTPCSSSLKLGVDSRVPGTVAWRKSRGCA